MNSSHFLGFVTGFGDQGVILPFVAAVAVTLFAVHARREALYWSAAITASLLAALVAKIVFIPCGHLLPWLDIRSPSGHAAAAIAAYGGFAVLCARFARGRTAQMLFMALALIGGIGISLSRIYLHAHTVPEAVLGGALGFIAPAILYRVELPTAALKPRPVLLLLLLPLAVALLLHGVTLPVESRIAGIAEQISTLLGICD